MNIITGGERLAIEVIEHASKVNPDWDRPLQTNLLMCISGALGYTPSDIVKINKAEWQTAKQIFFGDRFDFRTKE